MTEPRALRQQWKSLHSLLALIALAAHRRKKAFRNTILPVLRPFLNAHPLEISPTAFLFKLTHYGSLVTQVTVLNINLNYRCLTPQRLWGEKNKGQNENGILRSAL